MPITTPKEAAKFVLDYKVFFGLPFLFPDKYQALRAKDKKLAKFYDKFFSKFHLTAILQTESTMNGDAVKFYKVNKTAAIQSNKDELLRKYLKALFGPAFAENRGKMISDGIFSDETKIKDLEKFFLEPENMNAIYIFLKLNESLIEKRFSRNDKLTKNIESLTVANVTFRRKFLTNKIAELKKSNETQAEIGFLKEYFANESKNISSYQDEKAYEESFSKYYQYKLDTYLDNIDFKEMDIKAKVFYALKGSAFEAQSLALTKKVSLIDNIERACKKYHTSIAVLADENYIENIKNIILKIVGEHVNALKKLNSSYLEAEKKPVGLSHRRS